MDNFFTELSDWEDGDGDEDATMNAGTGLMMSFMKQQDKAEQVTDVLSKVMNYIKPFQEYVSPMGAMGVVSNAIFSNFDSDLMNSIKEIKKSGGNSLEDVFSEFLGILLEPQLIDTIGFNQINSEEVPDVSLNGIKQFFKDADLMNEHIELLFNAFEKADKSDIAEGVIVASMVSISAFLFIESFKVISTGGNLGALAIADMANSAIALIATLASTSIGSILFKVAMTTISCFNALFGFAFSAMLGNIPTLLINLALLPGSWAAFGFSVAL